MKRSKGASLRLIGHDWFQSFKEKPKTHNQFEQSHRSIKQIVVNDFVEVRENEKNESAEHAPGGGDYTKDRQSPRNVVRLEPQPGAKGGSQSKKRQANVVGIKIRPDVKSCHGLQSIRLKDLQETRVTQDA